MSACVFCKIANRTAPAIIVFENERVVAFADSDPVVPGHTLVAPKAHATDIRDISIDDLAAIAVAIKSVSEILMEAHGATGINLLHASGRDAQQSVFHFHIHLVPRRRGDGLDFWIKAKS